MKCEDEERGRLCRIVAVVPEHRWRTRGVREYKIALLGLPVTAFRREHELVLISGADAPLAEELLAAAAG